MIVERRVHPAEFEVRSHEASALLLVGYAARFNTRSQDLGGFVETVLPGAFTRAIESGQDARALFNHNPNLVLGRVAAGTLRLSVDEVGLRYEADLPDTSFARDLAVSIQRGDITQSSFGFKILEDDWSLDEDGRMLRSIKDVHLLDVSPVTYPAYLETDSSIAERASSALVETRGITLEGLRQDLSRPPVATPEEDKGFTLADFAFTSRLVCLYDAS